MGKNKFLTGVILGAAVGGLLTLFDKQTREDVVRSSKKSGEYISKYARDPKLLMETSKEIYSKIQTTASQVGDDIRFINHKLEEIKEVTPQVKEMIEDTKDNFQHSTEVYKEALHDEKGVQDGFKGY